MSANQGSERLTDEVTTATSIGGVGVDSSSSTTTDCTCTTTTVTGDETTSSFASTSTTTSGGGEQNNLEMLANLWPKGADTFISVDELLEFFSRILGPFYSKDVAECLVEIMCPDEENKISRKNFSRAFSIDNWPKEHVAAMRRVFISRPEIINEIVDWRAVLDRMGLDMSESELTDLIEHAKSTACEMLKKEASESTDPLDVDSDKVEEKTEEILKMITDKLGKSSSDDCSSRNLPSGESVAPTNDGK